MLTVILLSACEALPFDLPWLIRDTPTVTPFPEQKGTLEPTPEATVEIDEIQPLTSLTIWVPPEMDPDLNTAASKFFVDRLQAFSDENGGIEIIVRIKAASGVGGLLDALTASASAAPGNLPDLIALTSPELEAAALKGLIYPLDGMTEYPDDTDWYTFAREMALIQGTTFGLPFAADALSLAYRPEYIQHFPVSWTELFEEKRGFELAFPADQDQALFLMNLYLAEGGTLQDSQRKPLLELEPLTNVFQLLEDGAAAGVFSDQLHQYQTFTQVWTAFQEQQENFAVTWMTNILKEQSIEVSAAPLFAGSEGQFALGTGLSWAIASQNEHRHPLAVALAEYLVQPGYLADWTQAAGYIPTRPSALEGWQNQNIRTTVSQIALITHLRPSHDVALSLGPILRDGGRQILQGLADPAETAQFAINSLGDF